MIHDIRHKAAAMAKDEGCRTSEVGIPGRIANSAGCWRWTKRNVYDVADGARRNTFAGVGGDCGPTLNWTRA